MPLAEFDDAAKQCTWVEGKTRCKEKPVHGSSRTSLCEKHTKAQRALTTEPGP